ncbi:MAG: hypothetical protein U9Q98_02565 [Bacteroidota bacterium]|nr:hypothetical protein [Bacteroidota bacterium]
MQKIITTGDWLLLPIYLMIMLVIAAMYRGSLKDEQDKKFFMWGLWAKLAGGLAFALVYVYYYGGGDTTSYWHSANCLINLAGENFHAFWKLMTGSMDAEYLSAFNHNTGYPLYRHDPKAFAANRFLVPFVFLGAKKFLVSTLVLDFLLYFVVFRFYRFLRRLYPDQQLVTAIAVLFIPSVLFWGSGLLKDSLTFSFTLLSIISLYYLIIKPKHVFRYFLYLLFSAYIVISIKPYIFFALLAAALVWAIVQYTKNIKGAFLRFVLMPVLSLTVLAGGMFAFSQLSGAVGGYYSDMDAMAEQAVVIQDDLTRDYYGGNSFDIGAFEPTLGGMLSKFPQATAAGLYRPYLWDSATVFMLLSGLENLVLMFLTLYILIKIGPVKLLRQLGQDPYLVFCFVFAIILAFFIGLTTANFGALVRYRIPMLPFFVFALLKIYMVNRKLKKEKK